MFSCQNKNIKKKFFFTKRVYLIKELVVPKKFNQLMKKFENFDK